MSMHLPTEGLPQSRLVPIDQVPKQRRPYGSTRRGVSNVGTRIVTPAGVFAQVISTTGNPASVGHVSFGEEVEMEVDPIDQGVSVMYVETGDDVEGAAGDDVEVLQGASADDGEARKRAHKKERQWRKWSEDIIPVLLKPYLTLMRETQSLPHVEGVRGRRGCTGCTVGRLIEVSCSYFNRELSIILFFFCLDLNAFKGLRSLKSVLVMR